jgi:hypothetical protein
MGFQRTVNRNYTTGFPGEIVRDGPLRAKAVRIAALTPTIPARYAAGNLIGRVYGYVGEVPATGTTLAALAPTVVIGGPVYAGVLIHPKHYVLQGNAVDGTLGASLAIQSGSEGEVADMAIIVAEVFNIALSAAAIDPSFVVGYIPNNVDGTVETTGIPYGALVAGATASIVTSRGGVVISGAKILNSISLSGSAVGAPVSGYTIVQLTI